MSEEAQPKPQSVDCHVATVSPRVGVPDVHRDGVTSEQMLTTAARTGCCQEGAQQAPTEDSMQAHRKLACNCTGMPEHTHTHTHWYSNGR